MIKGINLVLIVLMLTCCVNTNNAKVQNEKGSEWRDNNSVDNKPFYNSKESCQMIIGKINIISRLHKNFIEKGVFGGGMSSRWLEVDQDSIKFYASDGEVADRGSYRCENGILKVDWEIRHNKIIEYKIHFNSKDTIELRYYDYPYNFDDFSYDKTKKPNNPIKVLGVFKK